MGLRLVVAFVAGYASVVTPCVLPLVPGYLSAVSGVDPDELGRAGAARRVVVASIPFILGFTLVFVVVGAGAAAISNVVTPSAQADVAGFVLVVLGLAFVGLLPVPERVIAPGLLVGARKRGSRALLGGAFAVCAAPCCAVPCSSPRMPSVSAPHSSPPVSPSAARCRHSAGSATATRPSRSRAGSPSWPSASFSSSTGTGGCTWR